MQLLDHPTFFKQLEGLFESTDKKGSIWLTHKRFTYTGGESAIKTEGDDETEYPVLVRATDGKKINFETKVEPGELDAFHAAYGTLLKSSMSSLRKRDKKKEKQRAEAIAKKKARLAEAVLVKGPKRGAGRRKRQRMVKAGLKQEETKKRIDDREAARAKSAAKAN